MAKQPKIRFKGFTEEWKEKKISDLLLERIDMAPQNDAYPLMAFVANKGIVSKGDRYDRSALIKDAVNKPYKRTSYGDFIYSSNNLEAGSIGMNFYGNASISPVYSIFAPKGDNNPYYLGVRLAMPDVIHEMVRCRQGVVYGQWKIHEDEFLNISVKMPKPDEQKAISQVIIDLTTTISQRETELEKLKNIKRALLEKLFPQDGQSIPAIRFKGFEGKWENRRLKDIATRVTRKNIGLESTLPLCISAQLGLVSQTEYYNNVVVGANLANYFLIKKGEFAYNKSAAGEYPMGAVKCLKSLDKGILSTLYIVFALKDDIDADYVQAHYETKPWQDDVKKRVAVGARNHGLLNISPEDFFDSLVVIPHNNDEQKKVGLILAKLSQTISLRERQLNLLKHSKQALLEQMFVNE